MGYLLIGFLAVSTGEQTIPNAAEKTESSSGNADDIVMLEIDVKEPVKRSPISGSAEYGASPNQYILQSADGIQEVINHFLMLRFVGIVLIKYSSLCLQNNSNFASIFGN